MAATDATVTVEYELPGEQVTQVWGTIAFGSSYPTGGYVLGTTGDVDFLEVIVNAGSVSCRYDRANKKLLCYLSNGASPALLAQAPNTTDLSSITAAVFYGIRPN